MACGVPAVVSDIMSLRLIEPAMKSKLTVKDVNEAIQNFFKLSKKEKRKISIASRKFIINECSRKRLKPIYLKAILD